MASMKDARLGLWTDYNRHYLDQRQVLAPDKWATWMTAAVAVCLTLSSPYMFKIAASFLVWLIHGIEGLAAEWKEVDTRNEGGSATAPTLNDEAPLNAGERHTYGTLSTSSPYLARASVRHNKTSNPWRKSSSGNMNPDHPGVSEGSAQRSLPGVFYSTPKSASYASSTSSSGYNGEQNDDDYQRHGAARHSSQGGLQDRFGEQARLKESARR